MNKSCLKIRLYPDRAQARELESTLETCRLVYNSLVGDRKFQYDTAKVSVGRYTQQAYLPKWKKAHPELKEVYSQVLQDVVHRVDLAFKAFFDRVAKGDTPGFPRLKGEGQYDSITFTQDDSFKVGDSTIRLAKIGQVKAKLHRRPWGELKTCTVRRINNKWFACLCQEVEAEHLPPSDEAVGIDVGLKTFAAFSNGEFIENPRFFRKEEKTLAKAQRKLSKQKRGSRERKKARKVVSRIHERIRNRRHDFCHQNTRRIVNRFGVIAVEKLSVQNMLGNHCLAKSIADASWSQFRSVLTSKAENAGREVIAVNPAYTSQDCSGCGYRPDGKEGRTKKKLSDRWHLCPMCGLCRPRYQCRRKHIGCGTTQPRYLDSVEARPFMDVELSPTLIPGFSVRMGGATSIDVTKPGIDKAYGIRKLRDVLVIPLSEMLFIGDALFPGGNDYPAKEAGVVSLPVRGPGETKLMVTAIIACLGGSE